MTIPADIREKAKDVRRLVHLMASPKTAEDIIARAILEERERCAQIAERACDQYGFWDDGVEIASAIRNEGEQKT